MEVHWSQMENSNEMLHSPLPQVETLNFRASTALDDGSEEASPAQVSKTKIEKRQMDVHLIASVPVNRQGKKQWILSTDSRRWRLARSWFR